MKEDSKKYVRKSITYGLKPLSSIIRKSPRLKRVVRNMVLEQMSLATSKAEDSRYQIWLSYHYPDAVSLYEKQQELEKLTYQPLISILVPTYNTEIIYLYDCIMSVKTQLYANWELCIVDDASTNSDVREEIKRLADTDDRIKYKFREKNGHISQATNDALAMAQGEFVGLFDHDDVLWPNALFEVVKALNSDKSLDFIYSDEEKVQYNRQDHQNPFFKPDWNPEFLESVNYITHFAVLRKTFVDKIGGLRSKYDGAQDWDLFLRAAYNTKKIHHIPTVLYSWRMSETSTALNTKSKPYVVNAQKEALEESLRQRGASTAKVMQGVSENYWTVVYPVKGNPKVSIVIPTKNQFKIVKRCIDSILKKTTYKNIEIILVDTGSDSRQVINWYKKLEKTYKNIKVLYWSEKPFSYAKACNFGAQKAGGKFLVMLNNDTEVITPNWIELLLSDAQRDTVGPVGCKLYYPGSPRIQHAGIGIGFGGLAANSLSLLHDNELSPLQHLYANTRHEVSAVTAACMMIKKDRFDEVNGFDELFRVTYNDVDLCLRLGKKGYRSIYNPSVQLIHHESISVGRPSDKAKRDTKEYDTATELFKKRWQSVIDNDPHLNPNIYRDNALFEVTKT
ncbi:MAG TPA: glycosyltransferase family 2 protein [Candidatus Sulfotelmatobacter sp.]|nr:glycosyltransferase family 2 protein [Candidatus Sulfotelmatobacter sp.]